MIKVKAKKRDIEETIWSVLTSFGFSEVEKNDTLKEDAEKEKGKYCYFQNNEIGTLNTGNISALSMAETAAMCAEASIAAGLDDVEIVLGDDDVISLLTFFGLEESVKKKNGLSGFYAECDGTVFAKGCFDKEISCVIDIKKMMEILEDGGLSGLGAEVGASVIFAEAGAEGLAYDVAYNLRINGCIVEYYTEGGEIEACEEYAKSKSIYSIIRVFDDGTTLIKDFAKNEIIETSVSEFLGYYGEDDEDECDCGCGHHHHGDDCDCQ